MAIMRTSPIWSLVLGVSLILSSGGCSSSSGSSSDAGPVQEGNAGAAGRADAGGTAGVGMDAREDVTPDAAAGSSAGGGGGIGGGPGPATDAGAMDAAGDLTSCLGACFDTLTAGCPKVIGCTQAVTGTETVLCYANGVKELRQLSGQTEDGTVKKSDGGVCYTWTVVGRDQTFMDSSGQVVAQLNGGATESRYTSICEPGQVSKQVDLSTPECSATYAIASQTCATGACSW
jgi:hypothetical protein